MYKTVRHGENSLQYTILPQDDHNASTSNTMKRRRSNRHRTAFILIITVILGCGIVAAAVVIPILLTTNLVALPARFQTFAVAASSVKPHGKYNIQGTQYIALLPVKDASGHFNAYQIKPSTLSSSTTTTSTSTTTTTTTTTTTSKPTTSEPTTVTDRLTTKPSATDLFTTKSLLPTLLYNLATPDKPVDGSTTLFIQTNKKLSLYESLQDGVHNDQNNASTQPNRTQNTPSTSWYSYFPWPDAKQKVYWMMSLLAGGLLLSGIAVGCLLSRRRLIFRQHRNGEMTSELGNTDKGTLLADVSGEED